MSFPNSKRINLHYNVLFLLLALFANTAAGYGQTLHTVRHYDEVLVHRADQGSLEQRIQQDPLLKHAITRVKAGPTSDLIRLSLLANSESNWRSIIKRLAANGFLASYAEYDEKNRFVESPTNQVIVKLDGNTSETRARVLLQQLGFQNLEKLAAMPNYFVGEYKTHDVFAAQDAADALGRLPEVTGPQGEGFAEIDTLIYATEGAYNPYFPNDPGFSQQWQLNYSTAWFGYQPVDMQAPEAWGVYQGAPTTKIMIIDDGVQLNHPDLNVVAGKDFTLQGSNGGPYTSHDKHGTAVAGMAAARTNNGIGIAGICNNCSIISARTMKNDGNGGGYFQKSWFVKSLSWGLKQGARISNLSWSWPKSYGSVLTAYTDARNKGMIHFASAGNTGSPTCLYPANLPVVNAVGATSFVAGAVAAFSNHGVEVDLFAPGESVYTTDRTGNGGYGSSDYAIVNGTSFASPAAAGVAGLILTMDPSLSVTQVENILRNSSDYPVGPNAAIDNPKMLNAYAALLNTRKLLLQTTIPDKQGTSNFGASAESLGDLNNDGFDDFAIGSPQKGGTFQSQVFVISGAPGNPAYCTLTTPNPEPSFGSVIANLGDVNGDKISDFAIASPYADLGGGTTYTGEISVVSGKNCASLYKLKNPGYRAETSFGSAIARLGDIDKDGRMDFAVGAPGIWVGTQGWLGIYSGASGNMIQHITPDLDHGFAKTIISIGDRNQDGVADYAVSNPDEYDPTKGILGGSIRIFSGKTHAQLALIAEGSAGELGNSLGRVGDVDGDGFDELVVMKNYLSFPSKDVAYLYSLTPVGGNIQINKKCTINPDKIDYLHKGQFDPDYDASFIRSLIATKDINGDSAGDIVATVEYQNINNPDNTNLVKVFSGKTCESLYTLGMDPYMYYQHSTNQPVLLESGDFNNDRFPDLMLVRPTTYELGPAEIKIYLGDAQLFGQ